MAINNLQSYIATLEANGLLKSIEREVDPNLEIAEITRRSVAEAGPALLFENVKGSRYPLAANLMATMERIEIGLGRHPEQIGEELYKMADDILPPRPAAVWRNRKQLWRLAKIMPRSVRRPAARAVDLNPPRLTRLPILTCSPEDAGAFVTLPLVITRDSRNGRFNMGMYRMQLYDDASTGMHFQLQKGGAFHLDNAARAGKPLDVAVVLGGDPALILSAVMALPEGVDEMGFAGFLRGERTKLARSTFSQLRYPAEAEFLLEGTVAHDDLRLEGPFGDHFGHYSTQEMFPVFRVKSVSSRRNPIYPASVVGKPPMEDRAIGDATQMILGPLIRLVHHEIRELWAYYEAGFHNLNVVSIDQRYAREALKTAFGILGQGQLSLTKVLILVGDDVNPRSIAEVAEAIRRNFDISTDLLIIPNTAIDTLDFTGDALHSGSKMIIDATAKPERKPDARKARVNLGDLPVLKWRLIRDCILAVQTEEKNGAATIEAIVNNPSLCPGVKIAVSVSTDVDIHNDVELIWGIFTRFDCANDLYVTKKLFRGAAPRYEGVLGVNAVWKARYPKPIVMSQQIVDKVDANWLHY